MDISTSEKRQDLPKEEMLIKLMIKKRQDLPKEEMLIKLMIKKRQDLPIGEKHMKLTIKKQTGLAKRRKAHEKMKSLETDEERQQRLAKQKAKNLIPQAEKTCK